MIDATPHELQIVDRILARHVPDCEVRAFGSRVKWSAKDHSDLDLVVKGKAELDRGMIADLKDAFAESDLRFRVDVVDWHTVSDAFRDAIEIESVRIRKGELTVANNVTLQDIAELVMGQSPPSSTYNEEGLGLPFFQGTRDFNYMHPTPRVYCSAPTRIAELGDILLSIRAPIGRVNVADRRCAIGRGLAIIRPKPGVDARFVEFLLRRMEPTWNAMNESGTVFGNATKRDLQSIPIDLPPLPEQRRIAHILGTLDDKIELNRRMNETLEEMARAVFKDWFVDFGPVRAKMEGREAYLPEDVWRLFPDRLVESELGLVPEGWGVRRLGDCYDLTMGQSPPGRTYNDDGEGVPFFQGRMDFGFRYPENRRYCTAPTRFAATDDTLISVRAPVGDINMAWERCCVGRGLAALRHKSGSRSFTYYSALAIQNRLRDYEHTGTVFGSINKQQFEALTVVEPIAALTEAFDQHVTPLDNEIRANVSGSRVLVETRDGLLPVLLLGELKA